jgi:hypothetical protein
LLLVAAVIGVVDLQVNGPTNAPLPTPTPHVALSLAPRTAAGIGALDADWEATHTPDTRFAPGSVYDPTPGLGRDDQHNAKYYGVEHENGRVSMYNLRLPEGTTVNEALLAAINELPTDARVVWNRTGPDDRCYQAAISSQALAKDLADGGNPNGTVFAEFLTEDTGGVVTSNTDEVTMMLGDYVNISDAPDC